MGRSIATHAKDAVSISNLEVANSVNAHDSMPALSVSQRRAAVRQFVADRHGRH